MGEDYEYLEWYTEKRNKISMTMSEAFSVPFYALIKLCYTKALEWSSLVPGPEVKSSSSEIMNPTLFTISYQIYPTKCRVSENSKERQEDLKWTMQRNKGKQQNGKTRGLFKKIGDINVVATRSRKQTHSEGQCR